MSRVLTIVTLAVLAASVSVRSVDPVLPQLADDVGVDIHQAALLATAFALPYAIMQPVLGAGADLFGKTRLITICLFVLIAAAFVGGIATNLYVLLVSRIVAGTAA